MEQDLLKRIEMLEAQVHTLQTKVEELEGEKSTTNDTVTHNVVTSQSQEIVEEAAIERPQQEKIIEEAQPNEQTVSQKPVEESKPKKQGKTFEQWITAILPKVFIVILVLGVLWGLKVVSDYGYFDDGMKILLGFAVSILLFMIAFWMEKRGKGAIQISLMLYGGAFIVGILTTAAGAILYDVLGLYVALFFALIYIAYGVIISYLKGSESLTSLVILTSFLLPYLLEYMDFSPFIIVVYVVLLFVIVQAVILKYQQLYALYVGTFFSALALMVTATNASDPNVMYSLAIAFVAAVFMGVLMRLFANITRKLNVHIGIIFSLLLFILFTLNVAVYDRSEAFISLTLLVIIYVGGALIAYNAKYGLLFDVNLSVALVALLTFVLYFNNGYEFDQLLIFVVVAIGLLVAVRLRTPLMQLTYSFLFVIVSLIIVLGGNVYPFWSAGHLTYVLVVVALILLYAQLRQPVEQPNKVEDLWQKIYLFEWIPIAVYLVILLYSMQIQDYYLQYYSMAYLALLFIITAFFVALFILPVQKHIPLLVTTAIAFIIALIILAIRPFVPNGEQLFGTIVRLLIILVIAYALFDFMRRGVVYEKAAKWRDDYVWIGGTISILIGIFSATNFIAYNDIVDWDVEVIANTVAIFATAATSLLVGSKLGAEKIRLFGVLLLLVGIGKLIFFDLSTLDLIVRSILFIVIGGVGLVLTNKLLTKN